MTLLCERCYGPIDPEHEEFFRLGHISHAEPSGHVVFNDATVHTEPCGPAVVHAGGSEQRRAA